MTGPVPTRGERWVFREMTPADAEVIIAWRYPPPYIFYDTVLDPELVDSLRNERNRRRTDLDPKEDRFVAVSRVDGAASGLEGFFGFRGSPSECTIGLGLAPGLTGRALGLGFVEAGLAFAREQWGVRRFRLEVASFNRRAIVVYERAGFTKGRTFERPSVELRGEVVEFIEMALDTEKR